MKYKLEELAPTPFHKLEEFLANKKIVNQENVIDLSMGQPYHPLPKILFDELKNSEQLWNKYPPVNGTKEYREAVVTWLKRRYKLTEGYINPETILPVSGTRESLFSIVQTIDAFTSADRIKVGVPNPCFQTYQAAVAMCGGITVPLNAYQEDNFLPSLRLFTPELCQELMLLFVCTPTNPQGMFANYDYIKHMILLAQEYNFVIVFDQCYSEIYFDTAPIGPLEVAYKENLTLKNIVVMHSMSKRSNAAGLRSGFVVGDTEILKLYSKIRSYSCAGMPLPIVNATIALLKDEKHVIENRLMYRDKFYLARDIFEDYPKFLMPDGGIFLWLAVKDAEEMCAQLWINDSLKILPGNFMTLPDSDGNNHGKQYLRIALVHDIETSKKALLKIRNRIRIVDGC